MPRMQRTPETIFRFAGLAACLTTGAFLAVMLWHLGPRAIPYAVMPVLRDPLAAALAEASPATLALAHWATLSAYALGTAAFAAAFWAATGPTARRRAAGVALLLVQILLGLSLEPDLLYIVAAELPFVLPRRAALAWLAAQMLVSAAARGFPLPKGTELVCTVVGITPPPDGVVEVWSLLGAIVWQGFAFVVGYMAVTERRQRAELAAAHAGLLATQQLLADSSRALERLRIARDIHDGLGHHLTALNLHLDLARRRAVGEAAESIGTARAIAQQLLAEVRATVGAERAARPIDLRQALQTLVSGIPGPHIEFVFAEGLEVSDPALAHAAFRGAQEAISNAIRHSEAKTIRVELAARAGRLAISVTDDGKGAHGIGPGNGLRGMRERIEELGGTLETESRPGSGFALRISLPLERERP